jgi:hypothetical protein
MIFLNGTTEVSSNHLAIMILIPTRGETMAIKGGRTCRIVPNEIAFQCIG